ncbi:hypothetical protein CRP01_33945 [Flavilitoribacter nigricans DSM 23189 = NBRC 102662]|uniref:Uncharacterized protein n=1 Tax=Flavilitoribacter nigricans (strain ATCC 23147 / DSM 23189 / NBRC 102662 / NCIMB 1420 / SS-2) TaxID=1122177 RepID=A0A2D0N0I4_FLAN2|nr:hypothetical protein CRP01_33945 [Flavilitoribacter nigricans DSM 23189 = NBRC 102662]
MKFEGHLTNGSKDLKVEMLKGREMEKYRNPIQLHLQILFHINTYKTYTHNKTIWIPARELISILSLLSKNTCQ